MLKVISVPILLLIIFLAYTIHSQDTAIREMNEYNHKIIIYSDSKCIYCTKAIEFLKKKKLHFHEIDITWDQEKLHKLAKQTGAQTVPYIFIDDKYIGGCTDLLALDKSGELYDMLK